MACLWSQFVILFWVRPVKLFSPSHEWRADIHQQRNSTIRTTRPKPMEWLSNADVAYTECVQSQHEHMLQHSTSSHLMLSVEKYQSMSGHRGRFPCCFMTKPRGGGGGRGVPAQKHVCVRGRVRVMNVYAPAPMSPFKIYLYNTVAGNINEDWRLSPQHLPSECPDSSRAVTRQQKVVVVCVNRPIYVWKWLALKRVCFLT